MKPTLAICSALLCAAPAFAASDYPVKAADIKNVVVTGGFWLPRFETNRVVTVRADFRKCEETGRLANFREAAKRAQGTFKGIPYDDSDVFKVIEGAAYTLATHPDPKLEKFLDDLIADIAGAQEPDGYLYTARTLGMEKVKGFKRAPMMGPVRWSACGGSHEFYNMGHMMEAGVAYYEATGKRSLLDFAVKAADMMDRTFGDGPGKIKRVPGHEEIELALCKLYRTTGDVRYLNLSKTLLDFRGGGAAGIQNHLPVVQQTEALGHAVRAGYLYTAMTDVAALMGDPAYRAASERLWENVVCRKLHLTGGIGAHARVKYRDPKLGTGGEAFGEEYDIPNYKAYLETCAAIANALWNERLFLFSGDGKYMDVIERIIYNGFLSGISLSGDEFFYQNPLTSRGGYRRSKWFGTSCCPVNIVRFIPQIASFAYSTRDNSAYCNLFIDSKATLALPSGDVRIAQRTDYPWSGDSALEVAPAKDGQRFALKVRVPGWAAGRPVPSDLYAQTSPASERDVSISVNGERVPLSLDKGYCTIDRAWKSGDRVSISMAMPVKRIRAHRLVEADKDRLAVERGPVIYCAEGVDNAGRVLDLAIPADADFSLADVDVCGIRMRALETTGRRVVCGIKKCTLGAQVPVKLVPYFAWCHRGAGEMQTWFPTSERPFLENPVFALTATASHVYEHESTAAMFDGLFPSNGSAYDRHQSRTTFWPHKGTEEWVCVSLPSAEPLHGVDVYWFDDEPVGGCRVPESWKVQVRGGANEEWRDLEGSYPVRRGGWCGAGFAEQPSVQQIRIQVKLRSGFSAGICELRLK